MLPRTELPLVTLVSGYSEDLWYVNSSDPANQPGTPPTDGNQVPIALPHSVLRLDPAPKSNPARVRYGFRSIGHALKEPVSTPTTTNSLTLTPLVQLDTRVTQGTKVLVEDARGIGTSGELTQNPSTDSVKLAVSDTGLQPPLRLLFNRLGVSRGQTVSDEVLGSGDATVAGQTFVLKKSPLTYFQGDDPSFPTSSLQIWVDKIEWREVSSFCSQSPDARVFVTREDESQKTHVLFGDGVYGARLPTGTNNVVASYRFGSGRQGPRIGTLTNILKPLPDLQALRNPLAIGGGDDPTPLHLIRSYAPRSVLTFGRAISAGDFEAIALQASGVNRARAYYSWDAEHQRATTKVYVGDDESARAAAQKAVNDASDPNLFVRVLLGRRVLLELRCTLVVDPRYLTDEIDRAVKFALVDDLEGLFSPRIARLGGAIYASQIEAACIRVEGVRAVHDLQLIGDVSMFGGTGHLASRLNPNQQVMTITRTTALWTLRNGPRYDPGEGGFFQVSLADIHLAFQPDSHD
jgi:hypothetical protein